MVATAAQISLADQQHLVLDDVSWEFYQHALQEVGNRPIFITFDRGRMEIMPPLAEHELEKRAIGRLVENLTQELRMPIRCFGSTTFWGDEAQAGLEPDECYYLKNESKVRQMKRFDPAVYPAPDLAIEIDITRRSIPRLPVYARLLVPEVWRYDGQVLTVFVLSNAGTYDKSALSPTFSFLPMHQFQTFVNRMLGDEEQNAVIDEFRQWVRHLPR